ncbi:4-(cytidine 5'-diphospho)-2-C-methyl-D-erythritol kinase [Helicobacter sp. 13S00477-4]|uniref:4-(cytidine 5'-diphospho)-2-C-methyl-D-erythritol kinase n=1 Tax=Helicobacter sp. 13S00477-4 TaxID=1905759 RepID=UPI000BA75CA4|nr:4-(cytidine 5'-diphospho)-2-C-methyl-D-erythritol kinase [Helicobacter sp. 13S00477-4]PAF52559.1 4-(cytidine 5'-diphospho)-2-C-methyl-D-erythritol kinase [Helicobacter sp. 13S00477-4]
MIFDVFPKLNIFLKILGFRSSYHLIDSRFVLAKGKLKDIIEFKISDRFSLKGDFDFPIEENLIYRCVKALKKYLDNVNKNSSMLEFLSIEVEKTIPKGAGLGGGSANAGVCLSKINEFFNLGLSQEELYSIAIGVGADVSFFVSGYASANVGGIGEILEKFDESEYNFDIFIPDLFCDTKIVYAKYDELLAKNIISFNPVFEKRKNHSDEILSSYKGRALNDLFIPAIQAYPILMNISDELGDEWFFSGSGSSFFRLKGCV